MEPVDPSLFYTGLVAKLYAPLRSVVADPEPYARFIGVFGEPALELGCGDGDPLLELRQRGLDVEGLDSSGDMLDRCRARAEAASLQVVLHESSIESMALKRRYRSIFLAGPTFNLLPDDDRAAGALVRIERHLASGGAALIPLFIPEPTAVEVLGRPRVHVDPDGTVMQFTEVSVERDEVARRQTSLVRYESTGAAGTTVVEREWVLHWHTQESFQTLATNAGLQVAGVLDAAGNPARATDEQFAFLLTPG